MNHLTPKFYEVLAGMNFQTYQLLGLVFQCIINIRFWPFQLLTINSITFYLIFQHKLNHPTTFIKKFQTDLLLYLEMTVNTILRCTFN